MANNKDFINQIIEFQKLIQLFYQKYDSSPSADSFEADCVSFIPSPNIDLSNIDKSIENNVRWNKRMRIGTGLDEISEQEILSICPDMSIKDGKVTIIDLERELSNIPFVKKIQGGNINLQTLSLGALEELTKKCAATNSILTETLSSSSYRNDVLNSLGSLAYPSPKEKETAEEQKARKIKAAYGQQCTSSQNLLSTLKHQIATVADFKALVTAELIAQSIPKDLVGQCNVLTKMMTAQNLIIKKLLDETYGYYSKRTALGSFAEWKVMLERINPIFEQLQTEWTPIWNRLKTSITTYEKNTPKCKKNTYYKKWKNTHYNNLTYHVDSKTGTTIREVDTIKMYLQTIQEAVDKTGGDGKLEYANKEDEVSQPERDKSRHPTLDTTFSFEDTKKPVFDHLPQKEDVQQGQIGDCYLMSALISLTKDNTDLIRSMIDDQGIRKSLEIRSNKSLKEFNINSQSTLSRAIN